MAPVTTDLAGVPCFPLVRLVCSRTPSGMSQCVYFSLAFCRRRGFFPGSFLVYHDLDTFEECSSTGQLFGKVFLHLGLSEVFS